MRAVWPVRHAAPPLLAVALAGCSGMASPDLGPALPATVAAVRGLAPHPCNATTASALDALGVGPDELRTVYYDRRVTGGETGLLQGYDVWIGLRDRPGELVVRHTPTCGFMTSYVRGGMRLGPA